MVAEFERDTLTERITDNMMELAKDGRWLGGNTPTGFTVKRVKTGSSKNKSAYSYLESIPEEKAMIQKLYAIFSETRSIKKTADRMNELGYRTKIGSKFNTSTTRLLLKNLFTALLMKLPTTISTKTAVEYALIYQSLTVSTAYPPITRPTKKSLRTLTVPSFLRNLCS